MKLCRYWANAEATVTDAKGRKLRLRKWGGSNASMDEAKTLASRALEELKARVDTINVRPPHRAHGYNSHDYTYSVREVPEELVKEISKDSGITRNGKGCLVLNSATAFFADIDVRPPGLVSRLFGASLKSREEEALQLLRDFVAKQPETGARIYRTKAGFRYLFTHAPLPVNDETIGWLKSLGSDPMYVRLCRNQNCYRARLTPKPHRLGCARVLGHYPFDKPGEKDAFASWLSAYEQSSEPYAVCSYVGTEGSGNIHRDLAAVVEAHDTATRSGTNLPLA